MQTADSIQATSDGVNCPCDKQKPYITCCYPFHSGEKLPATATQLMRSRYSAFYKKNVAYLLQTRHNSTRTLDNQQQLQQSCDNTLWNGLQIHDCQQGGPEDTTGTVTFSASYKENGNIKHLSETSRFVKENQRWYYIDGKHYPLGRNDICWCGSTKKIKRCHG